MGNLAITYQHIADILSFETPTHKLKQTLSQPSFNWDTIVVEGSKHLVLPAIYCRLKAKQLLHLLPEELNNYLEEITSINRNRNDAILKQVHSISRLLNKNNINHVFLKGSALLILGCYTDNAERMIGDIDILITPNQLVETYSLLTNNGYASTELTLGHKFFAHRHLSRLKPINQISSVEIHNKLFTLFNYEHLSNYSIFEKKIVVDNIIIPNQEQLLMHNILNFQVNDNGILYNSINFRSAYDTIILQRLNKNDYTWYQNTIFKRYFNFTSIFFKEIKTNTRTKSNFLTKFYLFKLKHIKFYKFWNKLLFLYSLVPILFTRAYYFISNSRYRKAVIGERQRLYNYFRSILIKK